MRYNREDGCRAWLTYAELPPLKLRALLEDFGSAEAVYDLVASGRPVGPSGELRVLAWASVPLGRAES